MRRPSLQRHVTLFARRTSMHDAEAHHPNPLHGNKVHPGTHRANRHDSGGRVEVGTRLRERAGRHRIAGPGIKPIGQHRGTPAGQLVAMQTFRPGYPFWQHVFTLPDRWIVFGSGVDGRLLAVFPAKGNWTRNRLGRPRTRPHPRRSTARRELGEAGTGGAPLGARLGPVLHNSTRADALLPIPDSSRRFLAQWAGSTSGSACLRTSAWLRSFSIRPDRYKALGSERGGILPSLQRNWKRLDYFSPTPIEGSTSGAGSPLRRVSVGAGHEVRIVHSRALRARRGPHARRAND